VTWCRRDAASVALCGRAEARVSRSPHIRRSDEDFQPYRERQPIEDDGGMEQVCTVQISGPDGRTVVVRPVKADDVERLDALFKGLAVEDRQSRFFQQYHPRREFIERMVTAGERGGAGVVAVELDADGSEVRLLGEAGFVPLPDGNGELAITVTADARGWLGVYLLDAVSVAASARGVANLEADVLTTDHALLALLRSRGSVNMEHTGWSVVRLLIGTSPSGNLWPRCHDQLRVLVEAPGGRWHAEAAARAAGMQVLTCSGPGAAPCPPMVGGPCALADGADVIVVSRPRRDESWRQLLKSHAVTHSDVPVYLEPTPDEDPTVAPLRGAGHDGMFTGQLTEETNSPS
jgi:hypothetical protein